METAVQNKPTTAEQFAAFTYKDHFIPEHERTDAWYYRKARTDFERFTGHPMYMQRMVRLSECYNYRYASQSTDRYKTLFKTEMPNLAGDGSGSDGLTIGGTNSAGQPINQGMGYQENKSGTNASDTGPLNLDYRPLPVAMWAMNRLVEEVYRQGYSLSVSSIDETSVNEKDQVEFMEKARIEMERLGVFEEAKQIMGMDMSGRTQESPDTFEDVEEDMKYYKNALEAAIEKMMLSIDETSRWEDKKRELINHACTYSEIYAGETVDGFNKFGRAVYSPMDVIIDLDNTENPCSDFFGHMRDYTIPDLIDMAIKMGVDWTVAQWIEVLKTASTAYNRPFANPAMQAGANTTFTSSMSALSECKSMSDFYGTSFRNIKVRLVSHSFISLKTTDSASGIVKTTRNKSAGIWLASEVDETDTDETNDNGQDLSKYIQYKAAYECLWLFGTDKVFRCGTMQSDGRSKENLKKLGETTLPFAGVRIPGKSIIERNFGRIDQLQLSYLKYQVLKQSIKPHGIVVDFDALIGAAPVVAQGQEFKYVLEQIAMWASKGVMITRGLMQGQGRPVEEVPTEIVSEVLGVFTLMSQEMQVLITDMGLTDTMAGLPVDPKTPVTTQRFQLDSASMGLNEIKVSLIRTLRDIYISGVRRVQGTAEYGPNGLEAYYSAVGRQSCMIIESAARSSTFELGITIQVGNDSYTRQKIEEMLVNQVGLFRESGGKTGISEEDYMVVQRLKSPADQILHIRRSRRRTERRAAQKAQQDIQMNAQAQRESTMVAEGEKRKTLEMEIGLKTQLAQIESQLRLGEEAKKHEFKIREIRELGLVQGQNQSSVQHLKGDQSIEQINIKGRIETFQLGQELAVEQDIAAKQAEAMRNRPVTTSK